MPARHLTSLHLPLRRAREGSPQRLPRQAAAAERGTAMVEFAIVLPLLLLVLFAITSFGLTYFHYLNLTDGVRVGARAAATQSTTASACSAATTAMAATLDASTWSQIQAAGFSCQATTLNGDPAVKLVAKYPYSINVLHIVVASGALTSTLTERLG